MAAVAPAPLAAAPVHDSSNSGAARQPRFRSFRGKSVSTPRPFDVFQDDDGGDDNIYDQPQSDQNQGPESPSPRYRSKSLAASSRHHAPPPGVFPHAVHPPLPSDVPPVPTSVLSPKPINVPVAPNFRALESTKRANLRPLVTQPDATPRKPLSKQPIVCVTEHRSDTCDTCDTPAAASQQGEDDERLRREGVEEATRLAGEVARLEAETDRILAEQKKLDLARLQAQLVTPPHKSKRVILDKLTFLTRSNKKSTGYSQPGTPSSVAPTIFSADFSRTSSLEDSPSPDRITFTGQNGKALVSPMEAPASAINGGDRRVTIRCLSSTISLSVTADTSPVDLLQSAAKLLRHHISPATSVVVECYSVLGLERRLRRYEPIRDVINSWDRDEQNSLLVLSCHTAQNDADLDIGTVPRTEELPTGFCLQMHHSHRPGKWNKRWVTLLDNGQMFSSKRADSKLSDKDSSAICHLSDFDIYTPKESEMRRHLKPPKKRCYAIKSQQKTVVFPEGQNFVHFFSTDDEKLAERFYDLVHAWRSWYLVNKRIDFLKKNKAPRLSYMPQGGVRESCSVDWDDDGKARGAGNGPFNKPLMDIEGFSKAYEELLKSTPVSEKTAGKQPATLFPPQRPGASDRQFSAGGLLGDAYDKLRQANTANQPPVVHKVDGPFIEGPSLLNGVGVTSPASSMPDKSDSRSWFPSATEHSARVRSKSMHSTIRRPMTANQAPPTHASGTKTLLNIAQNFPEPPRRWEGPAQSMGSGHGVRAPSGMPFISFAAPAPLLDGGSRVIPRRGPSLPPVGDMPPHPPVPSHSRARSRSTTGTLPGNVRRYTSEDLPPVPPLPNRSVRRERKTDAARGAVTRSQEPLVNRAR